MTFLLLLACSRPATTPFLAEAKDVCSAPPAGDAYTARGSAAGVVLLLHGGGWTSGAPDDASILTPMPALRASGWDVLSLDYPLADGTSVLLADQVAFVEDAVAWGRCDYTQVALLGQSAGAHLALLGGGDADAVVGWSSVVTLDSQRRTTWSTLLGTATPTEEELAAAAPITAPIDTPVLLVHGTADPIAPYANAVAYEAAAANADLYSIRGAGHGFRGRDASTATGASVTWLSGE